MKKDLLSDFNMPHGKTSAYISFPLFRFTIVIKLRNFAFEGHYKNDVRVDYDLSNSAYFSLSFIV